MDKLQEYLEKEYKVESEQRKTIQEMIKKALLVYFKYSREQNTTNIVFARDNGHGKPKLSL